MRCFGRRGLLVLVALLAGCGGEAASRPTPTLVAQPQPTAVAPSTAAPPTAAVAPADTPTPTSFTVVLDWAGYAAYRVQEGDTLASISEQGG
ncbi:MAG: hypothetical protein H0T53_03695, partial [Herpetosiphonaceae bacterium]|nr:hypothetical protein [Herpetosiphonaceae bacterium]